jgi:hypothetical protein
MHTLLNSLFQEMIHNGVVKFSYHSFQLHFGSGYDDKKYMPFSNKTEIQKIFDMGWNRYNYMKLIIGIGRLALTTCLNTSTQLMSSRIELS